MLLSPNLDRALRWALVCHEGQARRGSGTPYAQHVVAVAWILDRAGYHEEVVIAGLLHDVVEDTAVTLEEVQARFGEAVARLVAHTSEVKTDSEGRKRPWADRKRDHVRALASAPDDAKAVVLADKLHNLLSIAGDLHDAQSVWSLFHAGRDDVLANYRASLDVCAGDDPRLETLGAECQRVLSEVISLGNPSRH